MFKILIAGMLLLIISCQKMTLEHYRQPASSVPAMYFGLNEVDLKIYGEWTQGLFAGEKKTKLDIGQNIADLIMKAVNDSDSANQLMAAILGLKLHNRYEKAESYRILLEALYSARKKVRNYIETNPTYAREAMLVLSVFAEEVLYVQYQLFPEKKDIKFDYANINLSECGTKVANLDGIQICPGDLVLSKGDAGSSSFISKTTDFPGNFSHATLPYITDKKEILFIEADIADGVKLRSPQKEYINSKKSKLFVYRSKNPQTVKYASLAVEKTYNEVLRRVGKQNPTVVASYDYDFAMNAKDASKLFCSEVAFVTYNNQSQTAKDNPYPEKYWSRIIDPGRKDFLTKFLNTAETFPAPSDVEFNPNFELVAMHFDASKVANDRMMLALVDTLFLVIDQNQEIVQDALTSIGTLGSQVINPDEIKLKLKKLTALGVKLPPGVEGQISQIPKNINYKQLIFFSFLNEVLAPKVADTLKTQERLAFSNGKVLDLVSMRSGIYGMVRKELEEFMKSASQLMR